MKESRWQKQIDLQVLIGLSKVVSLPTLGPVGRDDTVGLGESRARTLWNLYNIQREKRLVIASLLPFIKSNCKKYK